MGMVKYFLVSLFFVIIATSFAQNFDVKKKVEEKSVKSYPIDGTYLIDAQDKEASEYFRNNPDALISSKLNKVQDLGFTVGTQKSFYAYDFNSSSFYSTNFTCKAVGNYCYVFVEDSLWNTRVNQAAVDSVQKAFDLSTPADPNKGIYQMDVDAFGNPPNVDGDQRIVILILNIRDGYSGSGGYIAGYFSSRNESLVLANSNKGEFYYVDANPLNLESAYGIQTGMSTTAHEFQHMINFNYHPSNTQLTFINESCSMLAELYCGYPSFSQSLYENETNYYLFGWRTTDDPLVLNDYSRAEKFALYIWDQFGIGIFKDIVQTSAYNGIPLYNYSLQQAGSSLTFTDVLINWLVANTLNDTTVNRSYGYSYPNITKAKVNNYYNPNASGSNVLNMLAADYISFVNGSNLNITFTANSSVVVKAIKYGSGTPEVVDVPNNTPFSVSDFGTTYSAVTFVIINTSENSNQSYSFTSTGTVTSSVQELKWDTTEPSGYLNLPAGDTVCVVFDGLAGTGAILDSIKVGLRKAGSIDGGVWKYNSQTASPLGTKLTNTFTASISTTPPYPYPVPWPNWVAIDLTSYNISAEQSFAVAFAIPQTSPGVMITKYPGTSSYHSFSYSTANGRWLFWGVSGEDSIFIYLIRAYVSLPLTDTKETVELLPKGFSLEQNYPNPFNPSTNITYKLSDKEFVTLKVYDLLGNEVATIVNEEKPAGFYNVQFSMDKLKLSSGTYFYRLQAGNFVETKKMILLK